MTKYIHAANRRSQHNARARFQLGEYWLWYHANRDDWCICWYDAEARTNRRVSTGVGGGSGEIPPMEAQRELARWFVEADTDSHPSLPAAMSWSSVRVSQRLRPTPAGSPLLTDILKRWYNDHASKLARAEGYRYAIQHLERFFVQDGEGRVASMARVSDVNNAMIVRFIAFRRLDGVRGETIRGDIAALRSALNWAEREELIEKAPRVRDVDPADRSPPRELEYSIPEVARLLEAAWRLPERRHVHLFIMIMLSTHARVEAVLELDASQIRGDRIFFNAPGRLQTRKKRSIVPIAPTLQPWIESRAGKIIRYRVARSERRCRDGQEPGYFERECRDIGRAFDACLIEAGLVCQRTSVTRSLRGLGSPNTLRHTIHTYLQTRGVPQAQIDAAAGHSSEVGSGRNYTHLRPEYLSDMIDAVEAYWSEMDRYTCVHRRAGPVAHG